MRKLTAETLSEVLAACSIEPCVHVGIVFPTEQKKNQFAHDLEKEVRNRRIPSALYLFDIYELWFESASNISIMSANEAKMRGRRYDIILYDEELNDDKLEEIGYQERPIEMKRRSLSKYFQWSFGTISEDETLESHELDEFLGDFIVNKTQVSYPIGGEING